MATMTMVIWDPMWQITNTKKKEKKGMANRFVQNFKKVNCRKGVGNVQSCYGNFTLSWRNLSSFSWKCEMNQSLERSLSWELEVSQGVLATKEHVVFPKQTCIPAHPTVTPDQWMQVPDNKLRDSPLCCSVRLPGGVKCFPWYTAHSHQLREDTKKRERNTLVLPAQKLAQPATPMNKGISEELMANGFSCMLSVYCCSKQHNQSHTRNLGFFLQ